MSIKSFSKINVFFSVFKADRMCSHDTARRELFKSGLEIDFGYREVHCLVTGQKSGATVNRATIEARIEESFVGRRRSQDPILAMRSHVDDI